MISLQCCTPNMISQCSKTVWKNRALIPLLVQVVALQLGEGHMATAVCCARLPSSSVTALHHLPQPPPEKEFVVVASYVSHGRSQAGAMERPCQGLLSVFEVCSAGPGAGLASASHNRLAPAAAVQC